MNEEREEAVLYINSKDLVTHCVCGQVSIETEHYSVSL